jgi:hypothetical protein
MCLHKLYGRLDSLYGYEVSDAGNHGQNGNSQGEHFKVEHHDEEVVKGNVCANFRAGHVPVDRVVRGTAWIT